MNYSACTIIIDYFIQAVEAGFSKEEAADRAAGLLTGIIDRDKISNGERDAISSILDRLAAI